MFNNITPMISGQVPEHLRTDSPLFVDFLSTYYAYASQRDKSIGIVQNYTIDSDIDYCNEEYIVNFYNTYGKHIPTQLAYDRRNFIKLLNSIYNAKGTEKALTLIFQAVFGEGVEVTYPGDQMLRASDGVWIREKFFTLKTEYGTIPDGDEIFFSFSNLNGDFSFESSNIERLDSTNTRIHYRTFYDLELVDNQLIYHYDTYGTLIYIGKLVYSPSKLVISNPGKDWVKGQAIIIPGTIRNTVAKVLSTNATGGITSLEILEYGHFHTPGQVATVSALRTRAVSDTAVLTSTMVTFSPLAYHHDLSIHSHVNSVDELITGTHTKPSTGAKVFTQTNIASLPVENADITGITAEDWFDSRAVFVVEYAREITTKGYYENSRGQISNQNIKIQDNYFYQAFSYLLETARDVREYSDLLNITHPAGLKRFSKLSKATDFLLTVDVSRTLSVDTIYLLSVYTAIDTLAKSLSLVKVDSVTTPEFIAKSVTKVLSDLYSLSELYANHLTKPLTDTVTSSDSEILGVTKPLTDTVTSSDSEIFDVTKPLIDQVSLIEQYINNYTKVVADTVTSSDSEILDVNKVVNDIVVVTETDIFDVTKPLSDQVSLIEQYINDYTKVVADGVSISELFDKQYLKNITDTATVTETDIFDVTKPLTDTVTSSDSEILGVTKPLTDIATVTELFSNQPIKYFIDSVTVSQLETTSITVITYAAEDYFAEYFTPYSYTLTIG